MKPAVAAFFAATVPLLARGEETETAALHFQGTVATQAHNNFDSPYSGKNSLRSDGESATSVVLDLWGAFHLWPGGEITLQGELAGGRGLSSTLGVAAFPSGEVYRVGNPEPTLIFARALLKQSIGGLTVTAGKFAVTEIFDNVSGLAVAGLAHRGPVRAGRRGPAGRGRPTR